MTKEELVELRSKLSLLSEKEKIERDLHLRKVALGEEEGVSTGYPNIDKPWLKYYDEEKISREAISMSAFRYLYDENKHNLNDIAVLYLGRKIKYFELFYEIEKVAKSLKQLGVGVGDIVTVCLPNTPEAAYLFYACSKIGAIADFIDPRENEVGLEKYLNISNPKHLVMLDMCFDNFKNLFAKKGIENVIVTSPLESLPLPMMVAANIKNRVSNKSYVEQKEFMKKSDTNFMTYADFIRDGKKYTERTEIEYENDRGVAIVHSGGTTGVPKGVLLSNDNLNELAKQVMDSDLQFKRHNMLMGVMPEFVGYGLSVGLHTSLVCGMKTMMLPKYEPEKLPECILKYKPNVIAGSPAHWEIFSKSPLINNSDVDLSFLKSPIEGGDTLNIKVEQQTNELLAKHGCEYKIQKGYGMTEKCSAVSCCINNETNLLGSVGVPFSKTNVKIYDNEEECELKYNEVGEICVNAPDVMLGYYNNEEETDCVIKTHNDGQKWLHSGDLGYITETGNIFIVGRIKDIIIRYDGIKIYPFNVESIILKHPAVKAVAIVGTKDPEHLNGEIPVAYVTINEEYKDKDVVSILEEYSLSNVADYALPTKYFVVDSLPKTKVGKVDKKALKQSINEVKNLTLKK